MTGLLVHYSRIIIAVILFQSLTPAQTHPQSEVDDLIKKGIAGIISHDYDSAQKYFLRLKTEYSELPLGKIYIAAAEIAKAYDYGEPYNHYIIENNLREAQTQALKLLETNPESIWNKYYAALTKGYMAYFKAIDGRWMQAVSEGLGAVSEFEECIEQDSSFYEAYAAIGTYKYWKSRRTEFLHWLPFLEDEKETGMNLLRLAAGKSSYSSYLAVHSLIWIYIDRGEYKKAEAMALNALKRYPGSRVFLAGLARAYEAVNRADAIKIYEQLGEYYKDRKGRSRIREVEYKHKAAQQYYKSGNRKKAAEICDYLLAIKNLSRFEEENLSERINRIRDLRKELSE